MPFKLIYFLFIVLCFGLFAGFNLKNTADISFIFYELKDIPIYISNLFSFLVGMIISLPFFIGSGKKQKKIKENKKIKLAEQEAAGVKTVDLKNSNKRRFWQKKEKTKNTDTSSLNDKKFD